MDYDGDSVAVKGVWTIEANEEIDKLLKSKKYYIDMGGTANRVSSNEAIHSVYALTRVLPGTKLTDPVF